LVEDRARLVTLGGGRQSFNVVNVSAFLSPGQNRFMARRRFELLACDATKS